MDSRMTFLNGQKLRYFLIHLVLLAAPAFFASRLSAQQLDESSNSKFATNADGTVALFDGSSLKGWKISNFGGEGDCSIKNKILTIEAGYPMSGVTYTGKKLPKQNYEILLQARRTQGDDFFCGLTFPVGDSHCTFIAGGWGGGVTGLSCIDGLDANSNDTRKVIRYEMNRWYRFRLRVGQQHVQVWIDDKRVVNKNLEGHKVTLRNETLPSRPLGICNFQTESQFKDILLKLPSNQKR